MTLNYNANKDNEYIRKNTIFNINKKVSNLENMHIKINDMFNIQKVTINSNKNGAGGYTLFTPKDSYSEYPTKKFLLANLKRTFVNVMSNIQNL